MAYVGKRVDIFGNLKFYWYFLNGVCVILIHNTLTLFR